MNLRYTSSLEAMRASTENGIMTASTANSQADIPTPQVALNALEMGFKTFDGEIPVDGENKNTFNYLPVLPVNGRASANALFDIEKIKKLIPTITAFNAPRWEDVTESQSSLERYISNHEAKFNLQLPGTILKASLRSELSETYTTQVMFSKKQRTAKVGYARFNPGSKGSFYDLLAQKAKDDLEGVSDKKSAKDFYRKYGTNFLYEVGVGACVRVHESVEIMHSMDESHIKSKLEASNVFGLIKEGVRPVTVDFSNEYDSSFKSMNFSAVGGDVSKIEDFDAYGKSAFEKPDIISFRLLSLYTIIDRNEDLKKIMRDVYYELMQEYEESCPDYKEFNERNPGTYVVGYQWKNTDWWFTADEVTLVLKYNGKEIGRKRHNRADGDTWFSRARAPGSNFGSQWSGEMSVVTTKKLNGNCLLLGNDDLRRKVQSN